MSNEKPLLSICIPTYNRSKYLKRSLDSIIIQDEFLDGRVEIVISDNASTDDTEEVVKPYLEKYTNIYYSKNTENVRDKNYPTVLSKAHGRLRRLCNDTLIFHPSSLKVMCYVVDKYKNSQPFIFWTNGVAKIEAEIENTHFREYVKKISYWMTSIACFSIWDNECDAIGEDFDGCELLLWQVKKGLKIASSKDNVLIVNKMMTDVQTVEKKNISYGLYQVFYKNYLSILEPYFESGSLSEEDKEYLEKDLLFSFFTDWVVKWELQPDNLDYSKTENLKEAVWNEYSNKPYWNEFLRKYYIKLYYLKAKKLAKRLLGRESN